MIDLIDRAAGIFEVSSQDILGKSKRHEVVLARWAVIYYLERRTQWGPTRIARALNLDHSTVCNALKLIEQRMQDELDYQQRVKELLFDHQRTELPQQPHRNDATCVTLRWWGIVRPLVA